MITQVWRAIGIAFAVRKIHDITGDHPGLWAGDFL